MCVESDAATELAALRAALQTLVDDASYAKGIKVVRAEKIVALLDQADRR
jgi:hypothetical protein